ncbi:MAG: ABC transporter ATP-binding protein [Desulfomonilaceae bacterium]
MSTVILIENLWKEYQLGVLGYRSLHKDLQSKWARLRGRPDPNTLISAGDGTHFSGDKIWALRDVSLEVKQGENLGIIGPNGAGKSTLLKILSRVTVPTKGMVKMKGRVASLLEIGTGFHPELTGRENIFLNGAILGMTVKKTKSKFDEIVEFSGIERFIDTPVKRYSSGMYVRLAFAVAAHLDSEILILDEVLAVGDAEFQKKSQSKMKAVMEEGRTILFVSHNLAAIRKFCTEVAWIDKGTIRRRGDCEDVVAAYQSKVIKAETYEGLDFCVQALPPDPSFRMASVRISQDGRETLSVFNGRPVKIELFYDVLQPTPGLRVLVDVLDEEENLLIRTFHDENSEGIMITPSSRYLSVCVIPANILAPRKYEILVQATVYDVRMCTGGGVRIPLCVASSNGINRGYPHDPIRSKIQPMIHWETSDVGRAGART